VDLPVGLILAAAMVTLTGVAVDLLQPLIPVALNLAIGTRKR
jgi:hypothetical protein